MFLIKLQIRIMKKIITKFDLFSSAPILRVEGEGAVMNLCSGIFSFVVFGFFTYIFFSNIASTVNLQSISATQTTETSNVDNKTIGDVVIGIGLQWMSLVNLQNIFQLKAFLVDKSMNMKEIRVFPCTRDIWNLIDDTKFMNLGLDQYMCIEQQPIQLFGQNGSPQLQSLYIRLSKCDPATSPVTCANSTAMTDFLTNQKIWGNRFFACSIAILDVGLNPTDQNSITYTIYQKTQWLLFNLDQQVMVQMFLGTFTINTDTNFMPIVSNQQQKGYFVNQAILNSLINTQSLPVFVQCFIFTSPVNIIINQTYGKFDQVLSYVGGLYGIVISFFAYFLLSFNQYRYELRVSEGAFSYKERYLVRQSDLHFGKYIKYVIYDWVKTLLCCEINWKDCKAINQARSQAIQQIDVKHLLQRISHLEKMNGFFISKEIETALYLSEAHSLQDVKHRRSITEYCQKFTDIDKSITISIFQESNALFEFITNANALNPQINKMDSNTSELIQYAYNHDEQLAPSLYLMKQYCLKYAKKFNITKDSFILTEDDQKVQSEIVSAFYALSQETRMKLIRKIPLGILYRINQFDARKKVQNNGLQRFQSKIQMTEENIIESARKKPKNNKILNSFDSNFSFDVKESKQ